jgi:hypothetical protein
MVMLVGVVLLLRRCDGRGGARINGYLLIDNPSISIRQNPDY